MRIMNLQRTRSAAAMAAICFAFVSNAATAYINVGKPETCGNSNGEMYAYISGSGSVPPYTYLWSNGATTETVTGVPGGSYSVTITDAVGTPYSASATVESFSALPFGALGLARTGAWKREALVGLSLGTGFPLLISVWLRTMRAWIPTASLTTPVSVAAIS